MSCPNCGKECVLDANFCSACGTALGARDQGAVNQSSAWQAGYQAGSYRGPRIVRPRSPRLIAGVCSGFALHYGWDVAVTRILFAILTVFTFPVGVIFYIAAWMMLPDALYSLPAQSAQPLR